MGAFTTTLVNGVNRGLPVVLDDGTRKYVYGLGLACAVEGSAVVGYHTDGQGSVRATTDAAGAVTNPYRTDEFGVSVDTQGPSAQPCRPFCLVAHELPLADVINGRSPTATPCNALLSWRAAPNVLALLTIGGLLLAKQGNVVEPHSLERPTICARQGSELLEPMRAAQAIWRITEQHAGVLPGEAQRQFKDVVRYLKGEPLEGPVPELNPFSIDTWEWPVIAGRQRISVVNGERQDSAAQARRGGGPALDLPGDEGQGLRPFVANIAGEQWFYDPAQAGHYCEFSWQGSRGRWKARFCHQPSQRAWQVGRTGNTTGPHLHFILWLNGERVRPEDQVEFQAMLM